MNDRVEAETKLVFSRLETRYVDIGKFVLEE